jgi:hypothetical protein
MTTEQLNNILNTKSYDYKFINKNSKDSVIISINGLGLNQFSKKIIDKETLIENGGSVFDFLDNHSLLDNKDIINQKSIFDFYNTFQTHPSCKDSDILFLADSSWSYYARGIKGIASNLEEIKDFILSFIVLKGYKTVYFIGTCSGSWLIALQSIALQINNNQVSYVKALLFNPLNDISESNHYQKKLYNKFDEPSLELIKVSDYYNKIISSIPIIDTVIHFVIYYMQTCDMIWTGGDAFGSLFYAAQ